MIEPMIALFNTQKFMPHGHCYFWQPSILWLQVLSNAAIAMAYFSIPAGLVYFVRRRADLAFNGIFLLFSGFILACGASHVFDIITIWIPVATAMTLWTLIPKALKLPSTRQLEAANRSLAQEVARRYEAEIELLHAHAELEKRIEERTRQLSESEELSRKVIDAARDVAIFTFDNAGIITKWNSGAERIFGYSEQEAMGLNVEKLFIAEDTDAGVPQNEMQNAGSGQQTPDVRWHIRKDGSRFFATGSCNAIFGQASQPIGYVKVLTDSTKMKLNELALLESEARFRATFDQEAVGITHVDEDAGFIRVNRRYCEMVGYSAEELATRTVLDLIYAEDQEEELRLRTMLMNEQISSFSREKRCIRKDGSRFWVQMTAALAEDPVAHKKYTIQVVQDIDEKKKAEEALRDSELRFRQLTENIREVFWIFDAENMQSIYFSPACELVYGNDCEDLKKNMKNILRKVHPQDKPLVEDTLSRQLQGEPTSVEFRYQREDGDVWLWNKSFPIRNQQGKVYRIAGITEDITARKHVEEELRIAKDSAEAANLSKSAFLANMSHEIRTPLNAIIGFSDLLFNPTMEYTERIACVATIQRNGQVLAQLIDDILDLSKVEAGKLRIERLKISIPDMMRDISTLLSKQASDKGLHLLARADGAIPSEITTDPTRLRQILFNIVGNAIKFTKEGQVEIIVRYEPTPENANRGQLQVAIRDTGRGLTMDEQDRLFKVFSQADVSTTREFGGTGLGLQLSRRLAQMLGGDVVLTESTPGRGSTFTISIATGNVSHAAFIHQLDSKEPQGITAPAPQAPQDELEGLRILVAEDAPDNQALIKMYLETQGVKRVEVVENGQEAIDKATGSDYDLILMDIQMPVRDGYSATLELRRRGVQIPIIALTAHAMREQREQSVKAGFDEYITKPVNKDLLIKTIKRLSTKRPPELSLSVQESNNASKIT